MKINKHLAGVLFAVIFGFSFLFSKTALNYITPFGLLAYRFLIAWLIFFLLRIFKIIKIDIPKGKYKYLFLIALFEPILYFICETYGLTQISSGEAGMMIALIPIFVTLLSIFILKEVPNYKQVIFIITSIIGVVVVQYFSITALSASLLGFLLLFGAVISSALFNITSRHVSKTVKPLTVTYYMTFYGMIAFNSLYFIELLIKRQATSYFTNFTNINLIVPLLYLGIVASIFGFFLVNITLSKMPAHVSSIYSNLSTIVSIIAGSLFLHETITIFHIIGAILIIIGVYGVVKFQKGKEVY